MVQAYILIQTEVGKAARRRRPRSPELPGVTLAEDVTGPYDVIVGPRPTASTSWASWSSPRCRRSAGSRAR